MTRADLAIRATMVATVVGVAAIAGWVSYWHGTGVVLAYGAEDHVTAHLVMLTVDGMIYASSMVLLWCARTGAPVPRLAPVALGVGITATLAANILHGLAAGPLAAGIAAWPAVALVISYELTIWVVRAGRELAAAAAHPDTAAAAPDASPDLDTGQEERPAVADPDPLEPEPADLRERLVALLEHHGDLSGEEIGRRLGVSGRHARRLKARLQPSAA